MLLGNPQSTSHPSEFDRSVLNAYVVDLDAAPLPNTPENLDRWVDPVVASFTLTAPAGSHIGEIVTLFGAVAVTKYLGESKARPTFLKFDKHFSNHTFTAVILGENRQKFGESPETFYKGKTVDIVVSSPPGGGYDAATWEKIRAAHLGYEAGNELVGVLYMLTGFTEQAGFAAEIEGRPDPAVCCFLTQWGRPWSHGNGLSYWVERTLTERKEFYPPERTLLATGISRIGRNAGRVVFRGDRAAMRAYLDERLARTRCD